MKTNEFLEKLLTSQALSSNQLETLRGHREEVEKYLREKYGQEPSIRYAGSKAKGTMLAESYDLDMTCYFPSSNDSTLKELHDSVEKTLSEKYKVIHKASAVRIKKVDEGVETDYHIDVVPGRFVDGKDGDVFIHVAYGEKERIQTNLETHISFIQKSECQDVIKLVKLWKVRNNVPLKTFVLEILVVETLKGSKSKDNYAKSLYSILAEIKDKMKTIKLVDPANSNNVVSETMKSSEKEIAASKAEEALKILEENENDELLAWKKIFDEESEIEKWVGPTIISSPQKPWCTF